MVAAVCVRLGIWQLDRLDERRAVNARVRAAVEAPPVPLEDLLAGGGPLPYRRVATSGTWDPAHEVILFGRALGGRPGNHVLTPLALDDDRAVLVDRGWVPADVVDAPVAGEAAASGSARVEGILLPADDGGGSPDPALPDQVREIDVAALDPAIPSDLVPGVYLLLGSASPERSEPVPAPLPPLSDGPHLSYAVQWFSFAVVALAGALVLIRRDRRDPSSARANGAPASPSGGVGTPMRPGDGAPGGNGRRRAGGEEVG